MDWTIKKFQELTVEELYAIYNCGRTSLWWSRNAPILKWTVETKPLTTYVQ